MTGAAPSSIAAASLQAGIGLPAAFMAIEPQNSPGMNRLQLIAGAAETTPL